MYLLVIKPEGMNMELNDMSPCDNRRFGNNPLNLIQMDEDKSIRVVPYIDHVELRVFSDLFETDMYLSKSNECDYPDDHCLAYCELTDEHCDELCNLIQAMKLEHIRIRDRNKDLE